jgi:hypothetical protein
MIDPNDIDTEGTGRVDAVATLIHDTIGDALQNDADLAGSLWDTRMESSDTVIFDFADGRVITVHIDISPKT